jgi:hypothetical protein
VGLKNGGKNLAPKKRREKIGGQKKGEGGGDFVVVDYRDPT